MLGRDDTGVAPGGRIGPFLLAAAILVAACGAASTAPTSPSAGASAAASVAPSTAAASLPSSSSPSAAPSTAASVAPSGGPVLDPERCPPTMPPDLYRTADGTQIDGDADFIAHVEKALALLEAKAPAYYANVLASVTTIWSVDSFSGMCYDTGTYRVGDETAHAPGHPPDRQVVWLAGTIVHDGCHRARYVGGVPPSGRDAELACLQQQVEALGLIETGSTQFTRYVQGLVDGVDDPTNQYWNDPNRHW